MGQEEKFLESLDELKKLAATQGNQLTLEDVRQYFSDLAANDEKMELIYQYFVSNRIQIVGREGLSREKFEEEETFSDEKEEKIFTIYMEELGEVKQLSEEEEEEIVKAVLRGEEEKKIQLIESNLKLVADIAKEYKKKGLPMGDIIQEGNMGLLQGVEEYFLQEKVPFHQFIVEKVKDAIEDALQIQKSTSIVGKKVASRVNELDEVCQDLAKELGREATLEEVAKRMQIGEDEVRELMKMSLDAISVVEPNRKKV